jgi:hypothetical protein
MGGEAEAVAALLLFASSRISREAVAEDLRHYMGGNVDAYLQRRAQNPIRYVNCE